MQTSNLISLSIFFISTNLTPNDGTLAGIFYIRNSCGILFKDVNNNGFYNSQMSLTVRTLIFKLDWLGFPYLLLNNVKFLTLYKNTNLQKVSSRTQSISMQPSLNLISKENKLNWKPHNDVQIKKVLVSAYFKNHNPIKEIFVSKAVLHCGRLRNPLQNLHYLEVGRSHCYHGLVPPSPRAWIRGYCNQS